MVNNKNGNNFLLLGLALAMFLLAIIQGKSFQKPEIEVSMQEMATNLRSSFLSFLSMGNKRIISSSLWITSLLQADEVHYSQKKLDNWLYLRFMNIADLEPNFYENYLYGGLLLSISKDDPLGASVLYDRGLELFPDDYSLHFNAGFNAYNELDDFKRGLKHFLKIENHPKLPMGLRFVIQKLKFETTKNYDLVISFLENTLENSKDEKLNGKIKTDLYAIHAEKDLNCLNKNLGSCKTMDFYGERYIYDNGQWRSALPFKPYKIHKRKEN